MSGPGVVCPVGSGEPQQNIVRVLGHEVMPLDSLLEGALPATCAIMCHMSNNTYGCCAQRRASSVLPNSPRGRARACVRVCIGESTANHLNHPPPSVPPFPIASPRQLTSVSRSIPRRLVPAFPCSSEPYLNLTLTPGARPPVPASPCSSSDGRDSCVIAWSGGRGAGGGGSGGEGVCGWAGEVRQGQCGRTGSP